MMLRTNHLLVYLALLIWRQPDSYKLYAVSFHRTLVYFRTNTIIIIIRYRPRVTAAPQLYSLLETKRIYWEDMVRCLNSEPETG